jgi:hypothetical protein
MYASIVGSGHFSAMCVVSPSVGRAMYASIVGSGHFVATFVISPSIGRIV